MQSSAQNQFLRIFCSTLFVSVSAVAQEQLLYFLLKNGNEPTVLREFYNH
jgi:hypothetical protein